MSTLFVLSHAPESDPGESHKLAFACEGDAVVLIEDAVYGASSVDSPLSPVLKQARECGMDIFALEPDLLARGIQTALPTVDYAGFIELLARYTRAVH